MATDMGRGIMAPDSNDNISSSGVQEMRTIASTTAAALDYAVWQKQVLESDVDLNDVREPGVFRVRASSQPENSAFPGESYTLEVLRMGVSWFLQRATNEEYRVRYRHWTGSVWRNGNIWMGSPGTGSGAGLPQTSVEVTGEWTTLEEELDILQELGRHREAEYLEIGRTVQGRPIPAIRVGFPNYPTVLFVGGQHGYEPGPREGLLALARDLLYAKNQARYDLSVLIVPNLNPDGHEVWSRTNANGQDLNRDWDAFTQPETQAMQALLDEYNIIAAVDGHNGGTTGHINFTESVNPSISQTVLERSGRLYEAVWEAVADVNELPNRYVSSSDNELLNTVLPAQYRIPSLVLEIPSIPRTTVPDTSLPPRSWMIHATITVAHAVINTVWRERAAFMSAKSGSAFTIPDRYIPVLEKARKAYDALDL